MKLGQCIIGDVSYPSAGYYRQSDGDLAARWAANRWGVMIASSIRLQLLLYNVPCHSYYVLTLRQILKMN